MEINSVLSSKLCVCWVLSTASLLGQAAATHTLTCPATVAGKGSAAGKEFKFLRPSIYNGAAGKEEYELAPDDEKTRGQQVTQIWRLSDYSDMNAFVRCRYAGTSITVVKDLPLELKTCTFRFLNVHGDQPVAAPSFECR
jgi:hypothetical protein